MWCPDFPEVHLLYLMFPIQRERGFNHVSSYPTKLYVIGGVSGVASFIATDKQLQWGRGCCFLVQAMLPEGFPFHQFILLKHLCQVID